MVYKNNFVVVIKCDGEILREKNGSEVYLPFGSEYSILLKNKDARRAVVSVELDGVDVSNGNRFILGGNESQEIKGFMRNTSETNRFKFIKKTEEIKDHRGDRVDDGLLRVGYQFEKIKQTQFDTLVYTNPVYPIWGDYGASKSSPSVVDNYSQNIFYTSCINDSINLSNVSNVSDEGITVKGSKIKQDYTYDTIGELDGDITTIVLQLKGKIEKNKIKKAVTVKTKVECEICGRKNKFKNNFCYNCGTYLN